jgi:membrane protease YdiL (CAAX protease family)
MFIFFNSAGRLRSGWRLLIFVVVFVALLFLLSTLIRGAYALLLNFGPAYVPRPIVQDLIYRGVFSIAALGAGFICTRWLEDLPLRALGIFPHPNWLRDFVLGSIIGIAALSLAAIIAAVGGGLSFSFSGRAVIFGILKTLLGSAVIFVIAALAEEALFRGYPLQTLNRAHLVWVAIVLTSVFFALAHWDNPNSSLLGLFNTALAGLWFVVAYLKTRSLWLPLGLHWSWNWALASVYGLPVSGMTHLAPNPLLRGTDLGPSWLTGGAYGIEGGIAGTIAVLVFLIFTWRTHLLNASEEMKQLTSEENPSNSNRISILAEETSG